MRKRACGCKHARAARAKAKRYSARKTRLRRRSAHVIGGGNMRARTRESVPSLYTPHIRKRAHKASTHPPRKWWKKCVKRAKELHEPGSPAKVCGTLWKHLAKGKRARKR